jgi:Putative Actinobacterial Holin-X, holin superfamily III
LATDRSDLNRPQQIGHTVAEISDKVKLLVREEIELAKTEVTIKATRLGKGAAVAAVAGILGVLGLIFLLHTLAWFFAWLLDADPFWGFLIVTGLLFLLAGIAAFIGIRWIKKGSPPTPDLAIEEAKAIRETVSTS